MKKMIKCGSRSVGVNATTNSTLGWMRLNDLGTSLNFAFSAGAARKLALSLVEAAEILDKTEEIKQVGRPSRKARGGGS
jgi:hypothetical protein